MTHATDITNVSRETLPHPPKQPKGETWTTRLVTTCDVATRKPRRDAYTVYISRITVGDANQLIDHRHRSYNPTPASRARLAAYLRGRPPLVDPGDRDSAGVLWTSWSIDS